jgi:hypothetical protein
MPQDCYLRSTIYRGFSAFEIGNEYLHLLIVPELGAKIAQILHVPSMKQWLWENPYLSYRIPEYGASYVKEFDLGGVDECFPTIGPDYYPMAPWTGIPVPDHGELWSQSWEVAEQQITPDAASLRMVCHGVRFPYRFERMLTVNRDEAMIHLDYQVTNLTPFAFPFLWSIHPLLRIESGMQLMLPKEVAQVRVDFSPGGWFGQMGNLQPWPQMRTADGGIIDLSILPSSDLKQAVKFFTLPLHGDGTVETGLMDARGERSFRFRFSPSDITHIGVWMNCAGWTPLDQPAYYNLALEPCLGGSDSLGVAVNHWSEYPTLSGHSTYSWSLAILLT